MPGAILPFLAEPLEGCTFVPRSLPHFPKQPLVKVAEEDRMAPFLGSILSSLPFALLLKVTYLSLVVLSLRCCVQAFSS